MTSLAHGIMLKLLFSLLIIVAGFGVSHAQTELHSKHPNSLDGLVADLFEANRNLHTKRTNKSDHQILSLLFHVAQQKDLDLIIRSAHKFAEKSRSKGGNEDILLFLLPLIFEPSRGRPDSSGVYWSWFPLVRNGRFISLESPVHMHLFGVHDFFRDFDSRRRSHASRTDLSHLEF